jgi:hypothetical protein
MVNDSLSLNSRSDIMEIITGTTEIF